MNGPILVFGAAGQLGCEVMALARARDIEAIGYNRAKADITDFASVKAAILAVKPRLVLNAAAYTAVDRAETEPEAAYAANAVGAATVARAAALQQVPVIQISTDYVFDGTKAAGEAMVRHANPRHFILRTAWVYGRFGANFLKTVLRLSREREELRIVADQHGCPTATQDLAEAVFAIDRALARGIGAPGTYHFAGDGATTWHGFARAIVAAQAQATGRRPKVSAIATADYPTPARRPANSELNSSLFASVFGYRARDWQTRARETVEMLLKETRGGT
jgi:dTDP-4-dehydrorhamnose reductase